MEDLAVVGHVGVVAVILAITGEASVQWVSEEELGLGRKLVAAAGNLRLRSGLHCGKADCGSNDDCGAKGNNKGLGHSDCGRGGWCVLLLEKKRRRFSHLVGDDGSNVGRWKCGGGGG